jgi:hypothetical protein
MQERIMVASIVLVDVTRVVTAAQWILLLYRIILTITIRSAGHQ